MSNNTEEQITQNVLDSLVNTPDARLKEVITSLITHVHTFIREVELTQDEWATAVQFLTRTGQMCDEKRQEFILLSDITGVTMLVDAINHRSQDGTTESTIFGPFYREGFAGRQLYCARLGRRGGKVSCFGAVLHGDI